MSNSVTPVGSTFLDELTAATIFSTGRCRFFLSTKKIPKTMARQPVATSGASMATLPSCSQVLRALLTVTTLHPHMGKR